jgi:transposase
MLLSSNWFEEALRKRTEDPSYSLKQISEDYGIHYDTVRKKFKKYDQEVNGETEEKEINVQEELINLLEKGYSIVRIQDKLHVGNVTIQAMIQDLKSSGYQIMEAGGLVKIVKSVVPVENRYMFDWKGDRVFRYGVVSDTHCCSIFQQQTFLQELYDRFEHEGIEEVLHAGDVTDGYGMRRGHEFVVFRHGADQMIEYVVNDFPSRQGMKTFFITGNHDHTFIKNAGFDIGPTIPRERPDMI